MPIGRFKNDFAPDFFVDLQKVGFFMYNQVAIGIFEKGFGVSKREVFHGSPEVK